MSTPGFPKEGWKRQLPGTATRLGWILLLFGVAVMVGGYLLDARRSAFNNIVLYLFLASLASGSVFLIALEYIAGAVWSVPFRRVNEFLAGLTPMLPLFALPLFFHLHDVFHWTHTEAVVADPLLLSKQPYLNTSFFTVRFIVVVAVWVLFYLLFTRNSVRQDLSHDARLSRINVKLAAVFLPLFAVTITVTAIDWAMSLEPHWYSTIFGVYYFSGTILAAIAAATYIVVRFYEQGYFPPLRRDHLYSLGALLFTFVNFWAYIAFSQFLLIWYANLPEETFWFVRRWTNGWQYVSVLLILVHFAVPYFALLAQDAKMDPKRLKVMAIWILFAHLLDLYWLVMPTYSETVTVGWMEIAYPVVAVGLVLVLFTYKLRRHNLVPVGDPKLERGLTFHL